jgi:hypothetical protein
VVQKDVKSWLNYTNQAGDCKKKKAAFIQSRL